MSEIRQTALCAESADCCNGPTNRWSACFEKSLEKASLTDMKIVKTV